MRPTSLLRLLLLLSLSPHHAPQPAVTELWATIPAAAAEPAAPLVAPAARSRAPPASQLVASCADPTDCTSDLQQAIVNAHWPVGPGALHIPVLDATLPTLPWITRPLFINVSNLQITFARGVVIAAKAHEFHSIFDSLLTIAPWSKSDHTDTTAPNVTNISLVGYGATLRMRKLDYQNRSRDPAMELYSKSEWRHGLQLSRTKGVVIAGLTIESTGGDGIALGASANFVEDTQVTDCILAENHRQGMSVGVSTNLLVQRTQFLKTSGTQPQGGVDLEPDRATAQLINIVFRDCRADGNAGHQFQAWLGKFNASTEPVSITFENCSANGRGIGTSFGGAPSGFMFGGMVPGLRGSITVVNSMATNTSGPGALFRRPTAASTFNISFRNTLFDRVARCTKSDHGCAKGTHYLNTYLNFDAAPLSVFMDPGKNDVIAAGAILGGISFDNCTVIDDQPRPYFILNASWPDGTETRRVTNVRFATGTVETTSNQSCRAVVSSAGTDKLAITPTTCTVKQLAKGAGHHSHISSGGDQQRWVSYWLSLSSVNATLAMGTLRAAGGAKVATSVFVDCGDTILADGSLQVGPRPPCEGEIPAALMAMGVGFERLIQSKGDSIAPLRAMFAQPQRSIAAIVALAKRQQLRGISWDVEPETDTAGKRLTHADALQVASYFSHLRAALKPLGVRLTVYNTVYSPLISNFTLLQDSVDRLLDGDTYVYSIPACGEPWFPSIRCPPDCNSSRCDVSYSNFSKWLTQYHNTVVNKAISRNKVGIAMMASTEDGVWNCEPASMRQRAAQLVADKVPELAIFELFPTVSGKCSTPGAPKQCSCTDPWFAVARDFLAGTLTKTDDDSASAVCDSRREQSVSIHSIAGANLPTVDVASADECERHCCAAATCTSWCWRAGTGAGCPAKGCCYPKAGSQAATHTKVVATANFTSGRIGFDCGPPVPQPRPQPPPPLPPPSPLPFAYVTPRFTPRRSFASVPGHDVRDSTNAIWDPISLSWHLYCTLQKTGWSVYQYTAIVHWSTNATEYDDPNAFRTQWTNEGIVIANSGVAGTFDAHAVFTPGAVRECDADNIACRWFFFFGGVAANTPAHAESIGVATASSPWGPFVRWSSKPVFDRLDAVNEAWYATEKMSCARTDEIKPVLAVDGLTKYLARPYTYALAVKSVCGNFSGANIALPILYTPVNASSWAPPYKAVSPAISPLFRKIPNCAISHSMTPSSWNRAPPFGGKHCGGISCSSHFEEPVSVPRSGDGVYGGPIHQSWIDFGTWFQQPPSSKSLELVFLAAEWAWSNTSSGIHVPTLIKTDDDDRVAVMAPPKAFPPGWNGKARRPPMG
jgi:hypothetical protein